MQMLLHSLLEGTGHVGVWLSLQMLEPGVACVMSLFWTSTPSKCAITLAVCCIGRYCLGSPQGGKLRSAVDPPEVFDHLAVANAAKTAGKPSSVAESLSWAVIACHLHAHDKSLLTPIVRHHSQTVRHYALLHVLCKCHACIKKHCSGSAAIFKQVQPKQNCFCFAHMFLQCEKEIRFAYTTPVL